MSTLETQSIIDENFFGPPGDDFFSCLASAITAAPQEFAGASRAFQQSLDAVVSTASIPFFYARAGICQRHFERLLTAARIRNSRLTAEDVLPPELRKKPSEEELERQRSEDAELTATVSREFAEKLATREGRTAVKKDILSELEHSLHDESVFAGVRELLRQAEVLIWGALEVLCNELFVAMLNGDPRLVGRLLKDERTRKQFQIRDLLSMLEDYDYNVSERMGHLLCDFVRIDDVETIRTIFDVLLPTEELRQLLLSDQLWKLYQRRNLIVHRRSLVDRAYVERTGETAEIGSRLLIKPPQLMRDLTVVRDIGTQMLLSLATDGRPPSTLPKTE